MASVKQPKLKEAHGRGSRACITWDVRGEALVTAGADARLLVHKLGSADEPLAVTVRHQQAITALCLAPAGHLLASASLDHTVKVYSYPGAEFLSDVTRFTLPIRSLAFSITGGLLAASGDDDHIKLITTVDNSIARIMKGGHGAPVLSLAFDPKNDILASADSDGTVIYWNLESGAKIHILKHAAPDVNVDEAGRNEIAWHPSGNVLAVPGHQFDVVMYDRDTAEVRFRLRGGHNTAIGCLAWSPNGKYLATAGLDRKVMVWDADKKMDLDRRKLISQATSLSWKPTGNVLAIIDVEGKFGVWEDPIPSHLASPSDLQQSLAALSHQELLHFSDDDVSDKENSVSGNESPEISESSGEEDRMDNEDSGLEEDSMKLKKEIKVSKKTSKESKSKEVSQPKLSSSPKVMKETSKTDAAHQKILPQPCAMESRPEKQGPFQPGSTRQASGARRFLAYNLLGCISTFNKDGVSHVEVEFHDTSRGYRVPSMADYNGFTMGALSEKGSIFASPQEGVKKPSTLVYRPFTSWASNSEWSMRFPLHEEVRAVAVGDRWGAAATSLNYLRIFSETGLQKYVLSLTGPIVTMASHQQLLGIVTHASDPLQAGEQVMEFIILDVNSNSRLLGGSLPLTPGAKLAWLGFSESGILSSYDSKGVLRIFSSGYGGCWIPVFSVSEEQERVGENLWVVGLDAVQIFCVKCKAPEVQPQVIPKSFLSMVKFSMPLVYSDLGAADLENELMRRSVLLAETYAKADEAAARGQEDDEDQDELLKLETELDRCLLRLIAASCQSDKLARALELATMLSLQKSLEGAIKIVSAMRLPSLAERLNNLLEGRRKMEMVSAPVNTREERGNVHYSLHVQSSASVSDRHAPLPSSQLTPLGPPTKRSDDRPTHPLNHTSQDDRSPQPQNRPRMGNTTEGISNKSEKQGSVEEGDSGAPLDKPEPELPGPRSPLKNSNPFAKPSNPFAKPSNPAAKPPNPFAKPSKEDAMPSVGEVSLLGSLKKIQKSVVEVDGKRKLNSTTFPLPKPAKANKAS